MKKALLGTITAISFCMVAGEPTPDETMTISEGAFVVLKVVAMAAFVISLYLLGAFRREYYKKGEKK